MPLRPLLLRLAPGATLPGVGADPGLGAEVGLRPPRGQGRNESVAPSGSGRSSLAGQRARSHLILRDRS